MDSERTALDASAFYAGVPFGAGPSTSYVTTSSIYDEISHIKQGHDALGALVATGRLLIVEPAPDFLDAARGAARRTGDMPNMSGQDISAIALCLEHGLDLITDDYAVSNVMHGLNLGVVPVMSAGIKDAVHWQYYCPGCGLDDMQGGRNSGGSGTASGLEKRAPRNDRARPRGRSRSRKHNFTECPRCGTALRRRPAKKRRVRA